MRTAGLCASTSPWVKTVLGEAVDVADIPVMIIVGGVCLLLQYLLQSCSRLCGGETMEDMCYESLRAEACVD